jgi:predicted anti-sigma-YlaC factor YlaD
VLGFDEKVWIPHVAAGALEVVTAFFTNTIPAYERRRAR